MTKRLKWWWKEDGWIPVSRESSDLNSSDDERSDKNKLLKRSKKFLLNPTQTTVGFVVVAWILRTRSLLHSDGTSTQVLCSEEQWVDHSLRVRRLQRPTNTGPRSVVVSASDCGSDVLGSNPIRIMSVWFFSPGSRAGSATGPLGRLEPHSRA